MNPAPRVIIGLPVYNGEDHVVEALESLLSQTHADIHLVISDDRSTDATAERIAPYAAEDQRIRFMRNDRRIGQIANARRVFELARQINPELGYYAWGSDNDVWHPRWLESLVRELDTHPEAVLAYPEVATLHGKNTRLFRYGPTSDTAEVDAPRERIELSWRAGRFGYRSYGLYRVSALERCGISRFVQMPDRLLLAEMAAQGRFREVSEALWYRRRSGDEGPSYERQLANSFPDGRPPLQFRLPWVYSHSAILLWSLAIRGQAKPGATRRDGVAIATRYLELGRELQAQYAAGATPVAEE